MKKILMTGVSSGIGLACAQVLLQNGFSVLGLSRNKPAIDHANFHWQMCDLANAQAVQQCCKEILAKQVFDGMIYCAGVGHFGCLEQLASKDMQSDMQVNCLSAMQITNAILPTMKKQQQGFCIYFGSEAALKGAKQGSLYCATKFALRGFSQSLAEEVRADHIRVTLINCGLVKTNFHNHARFEPAAEADCSIEMDVIAEQVLSLVNQNSMGYVSEIEIKPFKNVVVKK